MLLIDYIALVYVVVVVVVIVIIIISCRSSHSWCKV